MHTSNYKTRHLCSLEERYGDQRGRPYVEHLFEVAAKTNEPFSRIMERHGGDPTGFEHKLMNRDQWAFVLPDASEPGRYRVQYFDAAGFISHASHNDLVAAVEAMVTEGYVVEDRGALDRASTTPEWAMGTEVAGLLQRLNAREISAEQFSEERAAIYEKHLPKIAIAFPNARSTDQPEDLVDGEFISHKAYDAALGELYTVGGGRNSRVVPQRPVRIPVRAWRISSIEGLYGRELDQLRLVPITDLELPELENGNLAPEKRGDDVRYAQWFEAGLTEYPPIEVVETDQGRLRVTDGHRRVKALQQAGQANVLAWVSTAVPVPDGRVDCKGVVIKAGLTREIAHLRKVPEAVIREVVRALQRLRRIGEEIRRAKHEIEARFRGEIMFGRSRLT